MMQSYVVTNSYESKIASEVFFPTQLTHIWTEKPKHFFHLTLRTHVIKEPLNNNRVMLKVHSSGEYVVIYIVNPFSKLMLTMMEAPTVKIHK